MFTKVSENLKALGYQVSVFDTADQAADYLCGRIQNTTVGFGGSVTLQQMGLLEKLGKQNTVLWHWQPAEGRTGAQMREEARKAPVYLSSVNGLAETGEIINIDGTGNRVAETLYGHEQVYFVVGKNKLAPDYEQALWRARNIAAPKNAQRLNCKTPCAVKGDRCYDCKSPDRICRGLVVLWEAMMGVEMEVVLVDEELGY